MWVRFALGAISCLSVFMAPSSGVAAKTGSSQSESERAQRVSRSDYTRARGGDGHFSFSGRVLFYDSGLRGTVPVYDTWDSDNLACSLHDYVRANGRVKSNFGWKGGFDFSGEMSLEYAAAGGRAYGVDFMLLAPELGSAVERGKAVHNRGSRMYMQSPYGQLSVGFQEGVESSMAYRGGFDDFVRGREPTLIKNRLPFLQGSFFDGGVAQWFLTNAALLYPGLYSESSFRSNNYLDYYGIESESKYYSKYFINNLPFRVSYQTPRVGGLQFGISFSPTGYADDLFKGWLDAGDEKGGQVYSDLSDTDLREIKRGAILARRGAVANVFGDRFHGIYDVTKVAWRSHAGYPKISARVAGRQIVYAPVYRNILSAALALRREYGSALRGLQLDLVVSGECAKSSMVHEGLMPNGGFHNLGAFEVSALVQGRGLSFAASYGYLGRSGYPRGAWEGTELSWDRVESVGVLRPTSYMVLGAGYTLGALRVDGSYFRSRKGGYLAMSRLSDLGVRLSYELYRGDAMRCELFAQVNRVGARYDFAEGFVKGQRKSTRTEHTGVVGPLRYDFNLLAVGAKLLF